LAAFDDEGDNMITIIYTGLLGLLFIALSIYVVMGRIKYRISIGNGDNPDMAKRVRVHGNFAEYVPFGLLLLLLVDYCEYGPWIIHLLGLALLGGRVLHALALPSDNFTLRKIAMFLTFGMFVISSLLLIWRFIALQMTGF
jgi:uncharacterized membrane protein YecN with MAPEG domain